MQEFRDFLLAALLMLLFSMSFGYTARAVVSVLKPCISSEEDEEKEPAFDPYDLGP